MKITDFRVRQFTMPRRDPAWRTSLYAGSQVTGFVIEIEADGVPGIGATAAHVAQVSAEDLLPQIDRDVRELLVGAELEDSSAVLAELGRRGVHARAKLAADLAIHDALGKLAGKPCFELWGSGQQRSVEVVRMVGIKSPDQIVGTVSEMAATGGFKHFKIKIGTGVADDVARIKNLRDHFGDSVWLSVDANDAYDVETAIELCRALEPYGVGLIEQPIPSEDLEGLARVTKASPLPIMADDHVTDAASAMDVIRLKAADSVALKMVKAGSIAEARAVIEVCRQNGVGVHLGGSVAPGLVDMAAGHLVVSEDWLMPECEIAEFLAVTGDPLEQPEIIDGRLQLRELPGFGIGFREPADGR